ncbi:MAG: hypothetical protein RBR28_05600 [Lentimicrobium sp.]|jgi:hypothetical protein|nr:hypothetical protein [Lentimicrobium sp.]
MNQDTINILILVSPLLVGGIIAAINANSVNDTTEKAEAWTRRTQINVSAKSGWFYSYIVNPMLWTIVKLSDWTDSFTHRGLKNGVRVASTLYLIAAWCFLIYAAFMVAVILVIGAVVIYIIFKILVNYNEDAKRGYENGLSVFNSNNQNRKEEATDYVGLKGKKIYSGTNWFNEELKGRVDDEGNIYKGRSWFNEEKIGRIDEDGNILEGTNWFNENKVGRIDKDGNLHKGTNWFNEEKTGRIDEDGNIHRGTNWFNEEKTGRTGN